MLSNILVATDGSETSDRMVECLTSLGRVGTERVLLTHVFNVRDVGGVFETLREDMTPRLETQQSVLERAGFKVVVETHLGIPFVEINAAADRFEASLVVVGSLGASMLREALLGSTAHKVLENARRPVLLVRLEIADGGDEGRRCRVACSDMFGHILFPTDFSDTAERAFAYLEHVVRATGSSVTLLHVQDRTKIERHLHDRLQEFNEIDQARLDRMKEHLEASGAGSVSTAIEYGAPISVILNHARRDPFSLVLMGTQGRGFVQEIFLGSVANSVARLTPLPVLFVPSIR